MFVERFMASRKRIVAVMRDEDRKSKSAMLFHSIQVE
jgi:hypothetical protein